jgi:hypothetical protein
MRLQNDDERRRRLLEERIIDNYRLSMMRHYKQEGMSVDVFRNRMTALKWEFDYKHKVAPGHDIDEDILLALFQDVEELVEMYERIKII